MLDNIKTYYGKATDKLVKIAAITLPIVALVNFYFLYVNNVYVPDVKVISINYDKGIAKVKYKKKIIEIYGDASFQITGNWAVKLGQNSIDGKQVYDRIELTNNGNVYQYIN